MRSEWQAQQDIKQGRSNDAADRCQAVRDRIASASRRSTRVEVSAIAILPELAEAAAITIIAALVVGAAAYFFI